MKLLGRLRGPVFTILTIAICFLAIKAVPSLLWPERHKSIIQDEGYQAGHFTIGINERVLKNDPSALLFSTLKKWRFEKENPTPAPREVTENDGRPVKITGFMYPLESGSRISTFCLLRSTQTCCYGPKPQYTQYVLVEMDHRVPFERMRPVEVEGVFFVDPKPEEGYIYRMEGNKMTKAG